MPLDETHGISLWPDIDLVIARRIPGYTLSDSVARLRGFSAGIRLEIPTAADLLDEIIDGLVEELAR